MTQTNEYTATDKQIRCIYALHKLLKLEWGKDKWTNLQKLPRAEASEVITKLKDQVQMFKEERV